MNGSFNDHFQTWELEMRHYDIKSSNHMLYLCLLVFAGTV
jgi:hypothetical protein